MPELRKDPIVGRWVIIATERAKRPVAPRDEPVASGGLCPFCEGSEVHTPFEILAYRDRNTKPNEKGWRVRVVPNKFPALQIEGDLHKRGDGIYDRMNGVGAHEVIIECPFHEISMANLSEDNIREVLWVYRDRLVDLKKDKRLVYGMIFKNVGALAGASLEHSHSQLIVTPIVPISVQEEMDGAQEFYDYRGRCIYCDMNHQELATEKRIVLDTPSFVSFAPYASRFPFETWIVPRNHNSHFENIQKNEVDELGTVLKTILLKLETALDKPAYNYIIHTAPLDSQAVPHYHWHIEIIPRLTRVAGFEWGTGFYINPVPPEQAAAYLRQTEIDLTAPSRR
ncbi:MAG: galactose-1-phosphate uridylyltransferase [Planctomycetes bacterium]|nr:galactose-1-phosphate uridylyltransferase [Planctomycetota bacterium]